MQELWKDLIFFNLTGGWDRLTESIPREIRAQVDQAFENVEHTLRIAGATGGWVCAVFP